MHDNDNINMHCVYGDKIFIRLEHIIDNCISSVYIYIHVYMST